MDAEGKKKRVSFAMRKDEFRQRVEGAVDLFLVDYDIEAFTREVRGYATLLVERKPESKKKPRSLDILPDGFDLSFFDRWGNGSTMQPREMYDLIGAMRRAEEGGEDEDDEEEDSRKPSFLRILRLRIRRFFFFKGKPNSCLVASLSSSLSDDPCLSSYPPQIYPLQWHHPSWH